MMLIYITEAFAMEKGSAAVTGLQFDTGLFCMITFSELFQG